MEVEEAGRWEAAEEAGRDGWEEAAEVATEAAEAAEVATEAGPGAAAVDGCQWADGRWAAAAEAGKWAAAAEAGRWEAAEVMEAEALRLEPPTSSSRREAAAAVAAAARCCWGAMD